MEILNVIYTSFASIITLFALTKLMGSKQISELTMFDYINGITIGSIAAEMATSIGGDFLKPLAAMIIYAIMVTMITFVSNKSIKFRRFVIGKSIILINNGKIYRKNFARAKLDMNEFLVQCRIKGIFDLSEIQCSVMEPNGQISFLLKSYYRPAQPSDFDLPVELQKPTISLILDGKILYKNLKQSGKEEEWLTKELKAQGYNSTDEIFYAYCDDNNKLTVFKINNENLGKNDIFQ